MSAVTWWEVSGCHHSQAQATQAPQQPSLIASASSLQRPSFSQQAHSPLAFFPLKYPSLWVILSTEFRAKFSPSYPGFYLKKTMSDRSANRVLTHWALLWAQNKVQGDEADICPRVTTASLVHISGGHRHVLEFPDRPLACNWSAAGGGSLQGHCNQFRVWWFLWTSAGCTAACFWRPPHTLWLPNHF